MKIESLVSNNTYNLHTKVAPTDKATEKTTTTIANKDETSLLEISKKAQEFADKINKENQIRILERQQARIESHEEAHQAMGGGGIVYTSVKGPDGNTYHVHGHVAIDTSEGNSHSETISKMTRVIAAAMAPANPSPADMGVAASATIKKAVAQHKVEEEKLTLKNMDNKRTDGQKTRAIIVKVLGYSVSYYA